MKLIIQIPCYNEEKTLPMVFKTIPKKIAGVTKIETLIIDDGSTDKTIEVARKLGVDHIIRHRMNKGLALSFADGIHACLKHGADIIVNTDGDNQYNQADIPKLIKPILDRKADIVVGDRQTSTIAHFSKAKKGLQRLGSHLVRLASGTSVADAPSGFRAYSRSAVMSMNIISKFSYVTETIVQAGKKRISITHVAIRTNPKTRESRLFKNIFEHIHKSTLTIFRSYAMYEPMKVFAAASALVFIVGLIPYFRYAYLSFLEGGLRSGNLQSLIFGAVFIIMGFTMLMIGVMADLIAINRKLIEDGLFRLKEIEYDILLNQKLATGGRGKRRKIQKENPSNGIRRRIRNEDEPAIPRVI